MVNSPARICRAGFARLKPKAARARQAGTARPTAFVSSSLCLFVSLLFAASAHAQTYEREEFVVIKAGRIITIAGEEIENGEIVIVDGEIRLVGRDLEYPGNARIIDAHDQVVMPGLTHAYSHLGVPDYRRDGVLTHYEVSDDIDLAEIDFEPLLREGFTAVCLQPQGSGLPGMARVYRTAGPDEARLLNRRAGLRVTMSNSARDKGVLRGAFQKARAEIEKVEKARKEWEEKQKAAAQQQQQQNDQKKEGEEGKPGSPGNQQDEPPKEEQKAEEPKPAEFQPPEIDPAHKRLVDLMQKKASYPLIVEVAQASDVLHFLDVIEAEPELPYKLYLAARFGHDYHYVLDRLAETELDLLAPAQVTTLPDTTIRFNFPGELIAEGKSIAFVPGFGDYRPSVAELVRSGMARDEALRALVSAPAKFVGVEKQIGTIEKGKDGDLIFLDGDPLDPLSKVQRVMILGEIVWEKEEDGTTDARR